jgi:hypothetical protein
MTSWVRIAVDIKSTLPHPAVHVKRFARPLTPTNPSSAGLGAATWTLRRQKATEFEKPTRGSHGADGARLKGLRVGG